MPPRVRPAQCAVPVGAPSRRTRFRRSPGRSAAERSAARQPPARGRNEQARPPQVRGGRAGGSRSCSGLLVLGSLLGGFGGLVSDLGEGLRLACDLGSLVVAGLTGER